MHAQVDCVGTLSFERLVLSLLRCEWTQWRAGQAHQRIQRPPLALQNSTSPEGVCLATATPRR